MAEQIIAEPTYMEHVRHFFDDVDLQHMFENKNANLNITTYPALVANAVSVFQVTRPPDPRMPPDEARWWSVERHQTFTNWLANGFALGTPVARETAPDIAGRLRKDARDIVGDELETLLRAFRGIMALDPDDPDSYFALAGIHAYPIPPPRPRQWCMHREDRYNPWHRIYLEKFEDALRRVPGCADVTLPYWDITAPPPEFLYEPPFDRYILPREIHPNHPMGWSTERYDREVLVKEVIALDVPGLIATAMQKFKWNEFTRGIEQAHDNGHGACGPTMQKQGPTAFDPIFWFFHANWDRLWWEWQKKMSATTLWSFHSTIVSGQIEFLHSQPNGIPLFNKLEPFTETADEMIDLAATGVGYAPPAVPMTDERILTSVEPARSGSAKASARPVIRSGPLVSVLLKGVERLNIPGTFQAVFKADDRLLARRVVFQLDDPTVCDGCRERAVVDLGFEIEADAVIGRRLTVDVELMGSEWERVGRRVAPRQYGDPTLNVRLLLEAGV